MMSAGAIASALLAGSLAVCELFYATRKPPAIRALGWILVLFGFDGSAGLLVYTLLIEALKGVSWFVGPWPILLSGLSGPALLRSQLALLGSGQESSYYGPAVRYRRVQKGIERRIDQIGADAQSDWVAKALPKINAIDLTELRVRVTNFVKAISHFDDSQRQSLLGYIEETLTDDNLDRNAKYRAVAQKLIDCDCRQCVKGLVRRAKEINRNPPR
jgi:hypothetical protein